MNSKEYLIVAVGIATALLLITFLASFCAITCANQLGISPVAKNATTEQSSPYHRDASGSLTGYEIDGETVERGTLSVVEGEPYGAFGVKVDGVRYPFARIPAVDLATIIETQITHYGPPRFTTNDTTARLITIAECLELVDFYADEWGFPITGFCAVSQGLPWYDNVRDDVPVCIEVQGHGRYLVLDRKGSGDIQGVDIYEPLQETFPEGYGYSERGYVWRMR